MFLYSFIYLFIYLVFFSIIHLFILLEWIYIVICGGVFKNLTEIVSHRQNKGTSPRISGEATRADRCQVERIYMICQVMTMYGMDVSGSEKVCKGPLNCVIVTLNQRDGKVVRKVLREGGREGEIDKETDRNTD